ncbi:unnamed protein product [Moneuplotes crassus]|uniref:Uncharacterized protein n=1 Tax=Euplotes crassus TaxID=5936 RepID=A0AAD1UAC5_EUPCR|nr:unnamed protein product [Moneuplotes crassus]
MLISKMTQAFTKIGALCSIVSYTGLTPKSHIFLTESNKSIKAFFLHFQDELFIASKKKKYMVNMSNLDYDVMKKYTEELYAEYVINLAVSKSHFLPGVSRFLGEVQPLRIVRFHELSVKENLYDCFILLAAWHNLRPVKEMRRILRVVKKEHFSQNGFIRLKSDQIDENNFDDWETLRDDGDDVPHWKLKIDLSSRMNQNIRGLKCSTKFLCISTEEFHPAYEFLKIDNDSLFRGLRGIHFILPDDASATNIIEVDRWFKKFRMSNTRKISNVTCYRSFKKAIHHSKWCTHLSMSSLSDIMICNGVLNYTYKSVIYRIEAEQLCFQINASDIDPILQEAGYIPCSPGIIKLVSISNWKKYRLRNPTRHLRNMFKDEDDIILFKNRRLEATLECCDLFCAPVINAYQYLQVKNLKRIKNSGDISLFNHFEVKESLMGTSIILEITDPNLAFNLDEFRRLRFNNIRDFEWSVNITSFVNNTDEYVNACKILFEKSPILRKVSFSIIVECGASILYWLTRKSFKDGSLERIKSCHTSSQLQLILRNYHCKWEMLPDFICR